MALVSNCNVAVSDGGHAVAHLCVVQVAVIVSSIVLAVVPS